jgi:anti-sigma regulatory factor (Ser/Thr protein kinase)
MAPTVTLSHGIIYRFPADLSALPAILAHLDRLCPQNDRVLVQKVATAIEELFTNSVCHGIRTPNSVEEVGLAVMQGQGGVHIRYEDSFQAFDPFHGLDVIHDQAGLDVEDRPVGGLGRLIVHGLAHQATYAREGAVNRIDLRFTSHAAD